MGTVGAGKLAGIRIFGRDKTDGETVWNIDQQVLCQLRRLGGNGSVSRVDLLFQAKDNQSRTAKPVLCLLKCGGYSDGNCFQGLPGLSIRDNSGMPVAPSKGVRGKRDQNIPVFERGKFKSISIVSFFVN